MAATPRTSSARKSRASQTPQTNTKTASANKSAGSSKRTSKSAKTKTTPSRSAAAQKGGAARKRSTKLDSGELDGEDATESSEEDDGSDFEDESPDLQNEDDVEAEEEEPESEDDDSDDSFLDEVKGSAKGKKRKSTGSTASKTGSAKKAKTKSSNGDDLNLRVVKKTEVIPGPKTNPNTSIILPSTLDFLARLKKNNDREWFKARDAQYRHALQNVQSFCQAWVPRAAQADWSLPEMPVKDLMQRIHRDVRFSKSKIPYREHIAFSHSRTGRKGPFSFYYCAIQPGNTVVAAGLWQPEADSTKKIRTQILRDPAPLRRILRDPNFVKFFGKPDPTSSKRTSVYGHDDALKNAPKIEGVDKNHPDIDLLKLRSIAVTHHFDDEQVLAEDFLDKVIEVIEVAAPFIQLLNDWLFPPPSDDEDDGEADQDGEEEEEEEEEEDDGADEDEV